MSRVIGLMAAILFAAAATVAAQTPDFSGQWILEAPAAPAPPKPGAPQPPARGDMGSGWGSPLTITQDQTELRVEHRFFSNYDLQPPLRYVYRLDGTESPNTTMAGHVTQTRVSRTSWDGNVLTIVTSYPGLAPDTGKPFTTTVTQRLSLPSPTQLVIDTVRSAALGGRETTARTLYRRAGSGSVVLRADWSPIRTQ